MCTWVARLLLVTQLHTHTQHRLASTQACTCTHTHTCTHKQALMIARTHTHTYAGFRAAPQPRSLLTYEEGMTTLRLLSKPGNEQDKERKTVRPPWSSLGLVIN